MFIYIFYPISMLLSRKTSNYLVIFGFMWYNEFIEDEFSDINS